MAKNTSHAATEWLKAAPQVPEFKAPASLKAWARQRRTIRATLVRLLGQLPPRPKRPTVKILSREDRGNFVVEKFEFGNGAGAKVPGYVLLPKGPAQKRPAILYCHQHGGLYGKGGKEELFTPGVPVPVAPGPELARRGFVVLAIDSYCFGERDGRGPGGPGEKGGAGEMTAAKFNLWFGRSLWGMIVRDDLMALDYLAARPEVDATRIGVTGFSMGATRAWWLLALEERIKTGVSVSCLTRYQDLIATGALASHGIYYFVPGMLRRFDTEAVVALIAPRPVLFLNGDADRGSPVSGIRTIESKVRPIYRLYGARDKFVSTLYPKVGHKYLPETWACTLAWLGENLTVPSAAGAHARNFVAAVAHCASFTKR